MLRSPLTNFEAGSYALYGSILTGDATIVKKLRDAGAIVLGKTNMNEWANWRSSNISNGWSAYGGQTIGPFYPQQDPGGSSSGSGVAVALGLATMAIGTDVSREVIFRDHDLKTS